MTVTRSLLMTLLTMVALAGKAFAQTPDLTVNVSNRETFVGVPITLTIVGSATDTPTLIVVAAGLERIGTVITWSPEVARVTKPTDGAGSSRIPTGRAKAGEGSETCVEIGYCRRDHVALVHTTVSRRVVRVVDRA